MCLFKKNQTIEEIVAQNSAGMSDAQKAQYWWELTQTAFALLGKVEVPLIQISPSQWIAVAQAQYPTLTDIKIPDSVLQTTTLDGLSSILKRDWTNIIPYVADIWDCDKFAGNLYTHLCLYYKITVAFPIWGDTDKGYHGFNLPVVYQNNVPLARLIEPQTDAIFIEQGPLGKYIPRITAQELGVVRKNLIK